jgi:hypothetical protein
MFADHRGADRQRHSQKAPGIGAARAIDVFHSGAFGFNVT